MQCVPVLISSHLGHSRAEAFEDSPPQHFLYLENTVDSLLEALLSFVFGANSLHGAHLNFMFSISGLWWSEF